MAALWKPEGALDEDGQRAVERLRSELQAKGADPAAADKAVARIEDAARMYVAGLRAASEAKVVRASLRSLSEAATKLADLLRPESPPYKPPEGTPDKPPEGAQDKRERSVRQIPPEAFEAIRDVQMVVLRWRGRFSPKTMMALGGDAHELAAWARAAEAALPKVRGERSPLASGLMRRVQAYCAEATGRPTGQTTADAKTSHYALEALQRIVRSVERTIKPPLNTIKPPLKRSGKPPLKRSGADLLTGDVWKRLASEAKGKKAPKN